MERIKNEEYIFSSSVIAGEMRTLLGMGDLERLIEQETVNQSLPILLEFGYGDGKELENERDYGYILENELERVYELASGIIPRKDEIELLKVPNDYHNLKVLFKANALGQDFDELLKSGGNIEVEKLKALLRDKDFSDMTEAMKDSIALANETFQKKKDPQEIDIIFDKASLTDMLKRAEEIGNEYILGYVKLSIDMANVNSFVRIRELELSAKFLEKVFVPGGNIELGRFIENYDEQYLKVGENFDIFDLKEVFQKGALEAGEYRRFTKLEKLSDDMKNEYLRKARFLNYGVEPVFAFVAAKENEIKNLRIILNGKIAKIDKDKIRERMRETYV